MGINASSIEKRGPQVNESCTSRVSKLSSSFDKAVLFSAAMRAGKLKSNTSKSKFSSTERATGEERV